MSHTKDHGTQKKAVRHKKINNLLSLTS